MLRADQIPGASFRETGDRFDRATSHALAVAVVDDWKPDIVECIGLLPRVQGRTRIAQSVVRFAGAPFLLVR